MLIKTFPSRFLKTNTYLVACDLTKKALVIDPGFRLGEIRETVNREYLQVVGIVNTHTHIDHILGNHAASAYFHAPLMVHRDESARLLRPSPLAWFRGHWQISPPADRLLEEGDIISVGLLRFEVIHTPGHTPGGICLRYKKAIFTGDTLFQGSIGRTDLRGGDFDTLAHSIKEKLFILSDDIFCYPGHGERTTIGDERRYNLFVRLRPEQVEDLMLDMMKQASRERDDRKKSKE